MTARLVEALPVTTDHGAVDRLLTAVRLGLRGDGPAVAPHPPESGPAPAAGAGDPLLPHEDSPTDPTAVVVATSGSTGAPKAVLLPASALLASAAATHDRLGGPGVWLLAVPPHTVAGVMVAVRSLTTGTAPGVCDLRGGFRPESFVTAAAQVAGRRAGGRRYTSLVAAQVRRLLDAGGEATAALAGFDAVLLGGGPVPAGLREDAAAAGVRLVAGYGASETAGGCVYDGRPLGGVIVDITDDGRVRVAGPLVARGYRRDPGPAFDEVDGVRRFTSDDVGHIDDGVLRVAGRVDDVLITGGYKVSALLVADVLRADPGVADAVVVGVPDATWGTRIVAAVVAAPGAALDPVALRQAVARRLGRWAAPDVRVVPDLPMTGPGKVDREAVRRLVSAPSPPQAPGTQVEGAR